MLKRFLLGNSNQKISAGGLWYMLGGILNAGQSALLLMVISRTNSVEDSGIFSIAYAIACLALTIGNFGIRNYQSTDVTDKYPFATYFTARLFSDLLMLGFIFFYMVRGFLFLDYSQEKCLVILMMGGLKIVDSIEDVFHGMYQREGRLDIAGKCLMSRYIVVLLVFSVSLCIWHHLLLAGVITLICSIAYLGITLYITYPFFREGHPIRFKIDKRLIGLYLECLSLFLGSFLTIYISNLPKYAIDEFRTEAEQACYNYIFMPVYVVNLLNSFIYQPILTSLAVSYEKKDMQKFFALFFRQIVILLGLFLLVMGAGYLLGIPVLNLFYNTELESYKTAFMILLLGSGFLALQGYMAAILTIMRKQKWLLLGYGISALLSLILCRRVVLEYGVTGAAIVYSSILCIQTIIFSVLFLVFSQKRKNETTFMSI